MFKKIVNENIDRTGDDDHHTRSIHIFDTQYGKTYGDGYMFTYHLSNYQVESFRVKYVSAIGLSGSFQSSPIIYVSSNLARAEYACHRNGNPSSIISFLSNPTGLANVDWHVDDSTEFDIKDNSITQVTLEFRDDAFNVIKSFRFIVVIEFIHHIK